MTRFLLLVVAAAIAGHALGSYLKARRTAVDEAIAAEIAKNTSVHPNGAKCYALPTNDKPRVICWKESP